MSVIDGLQWDTIIDWTPDMRVRRGSDGTLAIWLRLPGGGYSLWHITRTGRVYGPVTDRLANGTRKQMRELRR